MKISCNKCQFITGSISVAEPEVPEGTFVEAHREKLVAVFLPIQQENKGQESKFPFSLNMIYTSHHYSFLPAKYPKVKKNLAALQPRPTLL